MNADFIMYFASLEYLQKVNTYLSSSKEVIRKEEKSDQEHNNLIILISTYQNTDILQNYFQGKISQ